MDQLLQMDQEDPVKSKHMFQNCFFFKPKPGFELTIHIDRIFVLKNVKSGQAC